VNALWIAVALLTAGFVGWPVTALVFKLARTIDDKADAHAGVAGSGDDPSADVTVDRERAPESGTEQGAGKADAGDATGGNTVNGDITVPRETAAEPTTRILRGGAIIGVLERLAVCLAILAGQPVAIAYVVAIKGLGRFAELKETPVAAERFIIGTLSSMLWAAGVAAFTKVVLLG
jgi:FAD/FMN-containing dehydrogenase